MSRSPYAQVLARPDAVSILALGVLVRTPLAGIGPLLTLHVVLGLGHSYTAAGIVVMVNTIAAALSGPWRGHLVDRQGLRPTLMTSVLVTAACWSVAPWVSYGWLLALGGLAGALSAPVWSMLRQGLLAAVPREERRTALSLDSITTEIAFMVGPLISLWLASTYPTAYVLFGFQMVGVLTLLVLWFRNPPMVSEAAGEAGDPVPRSAWFGLRFLAVCVVAFAIHVVLIGGDLGVTAALLGWDQKQWLGLVYVCWCGGSIVGALVYGAAQRHISPYVMLGILAVLSFPMALVGDWPWMCAATFVAGWFCAPSLTSTVEAVSELVPERSRGEAMGWHGSALTVGAAAGAPLTGWFIDHHGAGGGFVAVASFGLAVALLCGLAVRLVARRREAAVVAAAPAAESPLSPLVPGSCDLVD